MTEALVEKAKNAIHAVANQSYVSREQISQELDELETYVVTLLNEVDDEIEEINGEDVNG